jgi:hypothetical protein
LASGQNGVGEPSGPTVPPRSGIDLPLLRRPKLGVSRPVVHAALGAGEAL